MKKQKIAICDQDAEYTKQLVNYIAAKEKDSFEVTGFSDENLYRKNNENFDLLLYEETFFQNKTSRIITDELLTNDECLSQAIR